MASAARRCLALLLSVILLAVAVPVATLAEEMPRSAEPTLEITMEPTVEVTAEPTVEPTIEATVEPTVEPSVGPTVEPTVEQPIEPTMEPSVEPTMEPSVGPTVAPTIEATMEPSPEPTPSPIPLISITLDTTEVALFIGETRALTAAIAPAEASNPSIVWTSSDDAVATVDAAGVISAVAPGVARITATAVDGSGVFAECAVTVVQPISSLTVAGQARIQVGKTYALSSLDGETPVGQGVIIWSSSDEAIVTVDEAGNVTGVAVGSAVITAAARDGSGLAFEFPVEVLRATIVIRTKSNAEFSLAVCENNIGAEETLSTSMARSARSEFELMRLVLKTDGTDSAIDAFNPDVIIANRDNRYIIQFTSEEETKAAYDTLTGAGYVRYVEPDGMMSIASTGTVSGYSYQSWGAAAMKADAASEGVAKRTSASLKVAVVDSGVSAHSFLGNRLILGYDYVDDDSDPSDKHGHGTHVAGTIVDLTQALNVSVVAYRAFDENGYGYTSNITNAIMVAADEGCKVINLSARGVYTTAGHNMYQNAVNYAISKGATFVCAAGNDSSSTANYVPANLTIPGCIVVAAVDEGLSHCSFSNTGSSVDVAAPGYYILSTGHMGGFVYMTGTSMAAPHISAACAILKLANPGYSPSQVENALKQMCRDLGGAGYDTKYGYGIPDLSPLAFATPTGVSVAPVDGTIYLADVVALTAVVTPADADPSVAWESSNPKVAEVDGGGRVVGISPGNARITATTVNGLTAFVDLTVAPPLPTSVTIIAGTAEIPEGAQTALTTLVLPALADQTVTWSSSNTEVLTVDASGNARGVAPGIARVTAKTVNNLTASVDITVTSIAPTGISITAQATKLQKGQVVNLTAKLTPASAVQTVQWSSSNARILTVDASGRATGVSPGIARVTAKTVNGLTASVEMTVTAAIPAQVKIVAPSKTIAAGTRMTLTAQVLPEFADQQVTWSSSKVSTLPVDANGNVLGISTGTARITATASNGVVGHIDLTVTAGTSMDAAIFAPRTTMKIGSTMRLIAYVPPGEGGPLMMWGVAGDFTVLSVDPYGNVRANMPGTARVVATTYGSYRKAYINLTVVADPPTSITLKAPKSKLALGTGMSLTATIAPATGDPRIKWTSSNPKAVKVSENGYVEAVGPGSARITAKTVNDLVASVDVTVETRISATSVTIGKQQKQQLSVTGNFGAVTWTSANPKIATVSKAGLVTGKAIGKTKITASVDGLSLVCEVTVSKPVLSLKSVTLTAKKAQKLSVSYAAKKIKWSSSRSSVASVSASGKITAKKAGTATITATVDGYKLKCTVTVKANAHSYKVDMKPRNYPYGASIAISKVYYSGSSIYVDIYLVNNYSKSQIKKINALTMYVYDEGSDALLASKKFKNMTVNLKPGKMKKLTLKFTGSATKKKDYELRLRTQSFGLSGTIALK